MAIWRLLHNRIELLDPRCGMGSLWWRRGPGTEEEEARKEDARRASREATEEHGKPTIYENSGESQMEVTPE